MQCFSVNAPLLLGIDQKAAQEAGLNLEGEATGGCADSGFTSAVGTPTLCATGPVGGLAHSPEEYLELEARAEYKSEYLNGEIFAMAGASEQHNLIAGNIFGELREQLKSGSYRAYTSDMRVRVHCCLRRASI